MADLKKDLDTYLARNEKSQLQPLITGSLNFAAPDIKKWFTKTPATEVAVSNGWMSDTQKDCCPTLGRIQRIVGFCLCIVMGMICFTLSAMYAPVLILKARKFALLFTMGSFFIICRVTYSVTVKITMLFLWALLSFICQRLYNASDPFSFSFLWGPMHHLRHLFSRERIPFTIAYFGTLFATLYFALSVQSTPLTVLSAVGQIIALLWFLVSYIPGGQTGMKFFTRLCSSAVTSTVSKTLPV